MAVRKPILLSPEKRKRFFSRFDELECSLQTDGTTTSTELVAADDPHSENSPLRPTRRRRTIAPTPPDEASPAAGPKPVPVVVIDHNEASNLPPPLISASSVVILSLSQPTPLPPPSAVAPSIHRVASLPAKRHSPPPAAQPLPPSPVTTTSVVVAGTQSSPPDAPGAAVSLTPPTATPPRAASHSSPPVPPTQTQPPLPTLPAMVLPPPSEPLPTAVSLSLGPSPPLARVFTIPTPPVPVPPPPEPQPIVSPRRHPPPHRISLSQFSTHSIRPSLTQQSISSPLPDDDTPMPPSASQLTQSQLPRAQPNKQSLPPPPARHPAVLLPQLPNAQSEQPTVSTLSLDGGVINIDMPSQYPHLHHAQSSTSGETDSQPPPAPDRNARSRKRRPSKRRSNRDGPISATLAAASGFGSSSAPSDSFPSDPIMPPPVKSSPPPPVVSGGRSDECDALIESSADPTVQRLTAVVRHCRASRQPSYFTQLCVLVRRLIATGQFKSPTAAVPPPPASYPAPPSTASVPLSYSSAIGVGAVSLRALPSFVPVQPSFSSQLSAAPIAPITSQVVGSGSASGGGGDSSVDLCLPDQFWSTVDRLYQSSLHSASGGGGSAPSSLSPPQ